MADTDLPLSSYRVLDLTDERGFLCGKILSDLGADVVKIESIGGDPARRIGPFYHDEPDGEKSLLWFAYNTGKRGITLNLDTAEGKRLFLKMVALADFVIESYSPGFLDKMGIGYENIREVNPQIIMASITAWGQTGPYSSYLAPDIVVAAMGGQMNCIGNRGGRPLRIGVPQAYVNGAAQAAAGLLIANYYRKRTGKGQHVDVSTQSALQPTSANAVPVWETNGRLLTRVGAARSGLSVKAVLRQLWKCKDGFVMYTIVGGLTGRRSNQATVEWMASENIAGDLTDINWGEFDMSTQTQQTIDHIEKQIEGFFLKHTMDELYQGGIDRHIMLYPVYSPAQILNSRQLKARQYWIQLEHPELNTKITYPGAFVKSSEHLCSVQQRAPLTGEHNVQFYGEELGLTKDEIIGLKEYGVI